MRMMKRHAGEEDEGKEREYMYMKTKTLGGEKYEWKERKDI